MSNLTKEDVQGLPCKGHQDDGDALLWGSLTYASGLDVRSGIELCESDSGQVFRSPARADKSKQGVIELNSFSRDMATGFTLAAAASCYKYKDGRVLEAYERWVEYTLNNGCRACKDTDGRCIMTPALYWMASYAGASNVPAAYAVTRWFLKPYLLIAAMVNEPGFTLHLVSVTLFMLQIHYGGYDRSPFLVKQACRSLHRRQPKNAFFAVLANQKDKARSSLEEVKSHIDANGQGIRNQWCWERYDEEQAHKDSCGWDVDFIENLLKDQ